MNQIEYTLNLDLRKNTHQVLVMKEDDVDSRVIKATITDNGKPYNLNGCAVNLKWKKPDGALVYSETESVDSNTVKVTCTEQMLAVAGIAEAEFEITSEAAVASTLSFSISINKKVADNSDIESSDDFSALKDAMAQYGLMKTHMVDNGIHVPSGGTSGQVLSKSDEGKPVWSNLDYYTKSEINKKIGDIESILDSINGEVI